MQMRRRKLAVVGGMLAAGIILLFGVSLFGKYSLGRILAQEAVMTAELLSRTALRETIGVDAALDADEKRRLAEVLSVARADALLRIPADGPPIPILGRAEAVAHEFRRAIAGAAHAEAPFRMKSGAYSADAIGWFEKQPYRTGSSTRPTKPAPAGWQFASTRRRRSSR